MSSFLGDLRFALRMLAKSPGFTLVAVLTLALGIGANATVFSWIRGMILEPLPGVPDQGRVVMLSGESRGGDHRSFSVPHRRDLIASDMPVAVVGFDLRAVSLREGEQPERAWASLVSGNFFDVLAVRAAVGRTFRPEEDRTPGTHPVVVLAHAYWQARFHGDPGIVGRTVEINRHPYTVVGVAAPGFQGSTAGLKMDLWIPLAMQEQISPGSRLNERGSHWMEALGRLKPGATLEQAQASLDTVAARLGSAYPDTNDGMRFRAHHFWSSPYGPTQVLLPVLSVLGAMALLVLLLACANVANLLLVRALGRRKEISIRLALGAGRAHLIRQLLTESLVLAVLAGALGLLIARGSTGLLTAFVPPLDVPVGPSYPMDARLLAFAAGLSLLTGVLFSLAPILQVTSPGLASALRDEGGAVSGGRKGRLRSGLVIAQITLSCVLLVCAGLFLRSLGKGAEIDPGFSARNVLLASVDLFPGGYDEAGGKAFYRDLLQRLSVLPGVESASVSSYIPLNFGGSSSSNVEVAGYQPAPKEEVVIEYYNVGPDYFQTLGIPLAAGRGFDARDDEDGARVVVINQTMARKYWGSRNPIGTTVRVWDEDRTVVGIARDGKYRQLGEKPRPWFYAPILQAYRSQAVIHLRTRGEPAELAGALRQAVREIDPNLPLTAVKTLRQHLRISVFAQRVAASFLGSFGLLALALATLGLYSVIRYAVSQRTRELGVRLALGARPRNIEKMVVGEGMMLAAFGVVAGLALAFGVTRFLASQLLGVSATDPLVFAGIALLLAAVAGLSSYLPARAAGMVDPAVVLRTE